MMYNDRKALSPILGVLGMFVADDLTQNECISICPTLPYPLCIVWFIPSISAGFRSPTPELRNIFATVSANIT